MFFLLVLVCFHIFNTSSLEVYVSSSIGSDDNSGTSEKSPLKSLEYAIALAIKLKITAIHVEGKYVLTEKITLNQKHNGLIFDKWEKKEPAIISGGTSIPTNLWAFEGGIWTANLPSIMLPILNSTATIFVNGKRRTIVRTSMKHWQQSLVKGKNQNRNKQGFVYSDGDIDPSWKLDESSLQLWRVAAFHSWTKAYHHIKHVFPHNKTIIFKENAIFPYGDYTYCSNKRYYFEGIPEIPLGMGMWRYTKLIDGSVKLQYAAFPEEIPPKKLTTVVPKLEQLFEIVSGSNITIRNMAFSHTAASCENACDSDLAMMASAAIQIQSSTAVHITNVSFTNMEGFGIKAYNSPEVLITKILAYSMGAGGIFIGNCAHAVINNSYIHSYGQRYPPGPGINMGGCLNGTVSHNDISRGFYNGITGGGRSDTGAFSRYEFNLIHDNGHSDDYGICDYGGIHLATTGSYKPVFILNNIFRNITAFANGGSGIYLDVCSTAVDVENNLVHDVSFAPFHWGGCEKSVIGGVPTKVINNVFVSNAENNYYTKHGNLAFSWGGFTKTYFERNVIFINSTAAPSYKTMYGGLPCAYWSPPSQNCTLNYIDNFRHNNIDSNLYWNTSNGFLSSTFPGGNCSGSCSSFQEWKVAGHDKTSVIADPEFKNVNQGNFQITSKIALTLGIIPLKFDTVGPDWKYIPETLPQ